MRDVGVVYLCRFAEGEPPVHRFLQSYREHAAGLDHDFHVVFKGHPDFVAIERARSLFAGIPFNEIELEDRGFDVGSYVAAARRVTNRRLVFFNTFSCILAANWLRHLNDAMDGEGVGVAGATGSWQSNSAGLERALIRLFYPFLNYLGWVPDRDQTKRKFFMTVFQRRSWRYRFRVLFMYFQTVIQYGRHPNPHIRTNAFMVDRLQFLSLRTPSFRTKGSAYRFESGRHSLTRQYLRRGLKPVVVDRNGAVYPVDRWNVSATFWTGNQINLMVADNRTADYADGSDDFRDYLEDIAWVDPWTAT